jgi:hypothetical protein
MVMSALSSASSVSCVVVGMFPLTYILALKAATQREKKSRKREVLTLAGKLHQPLILLFSSLIQTYRWRHCQVSLPWIKVSFGSLN